MSATTKPALRQLKSSTGPVRKVVDVVRPFPGTSLAVLECGHSYSDTGGKNFRRCQKCQAEGRTT